MHSAGAAEDLAFGFHVPAGRETSVRHRRQLLGRQPQRGCLAPVIRREFLQAELVHKRLGGRFGLQVAHHVAPFGGVVHAPAFERIGHAAAIVIERNLGMQMLLLPLVALLGAERQARLGHGLHFLVAQLVGNLDARGERMFEQRREHLADVAFGRVDMAQSAERGNPFERRAFLQQRDALAGKHQTLGDQQRRQQVHLFAAAAQPPGQRPLMAFLAEQAEDEAPRLAIVPLERQPFGIGRVQLQQTAARAGNIRHHRGGERMPQTEARPDGFVRAVGHPVRVHGAAREQPENVTIRGVRQDGQNRPADLRNPRLLPSAFELGLARLQFQDHGAARDTGGRVDDI